MSKIYTGYFANVKKYRAAGLTTVSIARFRPRFYSGIEFKVLAPSAQMLKMTNADYDVQFKRILSALNPQKVAHEIKTLTNGAPAILLCYESLGKYCHRHLVSEWFNAHGIEVKEFLQNEPPKEPEIVQSSLF